MEREIGVERERSRAMWGGPWEIDYVMEEGEITDLSVVRFDPHKTLVGSPFDDDDDDVVGGNGAETRRGQCAPPPVVACVDMEKG